MTVKDIKRICQIYDNLRRERDAATIAYNSEDTFWEHVLVTYNLSRPSLPSNIDEAAEEWCKTNNKGIALSADKKSHYLAEGCEAFKAGAEWMAGQGWISVDESLPKIDEEVIVLKDILVADDLKVGFGQIAFGHIVDVNRCIDYNGWNIPGVKYWMPCPKIPGMND